MLWRLSHPLATAKTLCCLQTTCALPTPSTHSYVFFFSRLSFPFSLSFSSFVTVRGQMINHPCLSSCVCCVCLSAWVYASGRAGAGSELHHDCFRRIHRVYCVLPFPVLHATLLLNAYAIHILLTYRPQIWFGRLESPATLPAARQLL